MRMIIEWKGMELWVERGRKEERRRRKEEGGYMFTLGSCL
jgi:hypothetical protein